MAQYDAMAVRARLEAERERLQRDIYELTQGERFVQPADPQNDSGGMASEQADNANMVFEVERNQALTNHAQTQLGQVVAALQRLDAGTYGICARCGKEIGARRLEALPYATLCIDCQTIVEGHSPR
jgi:DnaK suppressor protein